MTRFQLILKSFIHYFKSNLLVALGVLISTMVLTGSLVIGDSVRYSLTQATFYRLGKTTHLVSVTERYFRQEMAGEIEQDNQQIQATPLLLLEGMAVSGGGQQRANKVQVVGIDRDFDEVSDDPLYAELVDNEIAISKNLAERLKVTKGDNILVRIKKASLIPMNAPFVSDEETSVSLRASIKRVLTKDELGRFSLKNSQTAPYNIFVSIDRLNRLMDFKGKANKILVVSNLDNAEILHSVKNCLTPTDAGLQLKTVEKTGEKEVSTERVFMDEKVAQTLQQLPGAEPVLTYFVNEISKLEARSSELEAKIPYSFVSTIVYGLGANDIVLNKWAADDLDATTGDSVQLKYFEIGPLRQLVEKTSTFMVQHVIPMDSELCDPERVPHLPGLSDAGHCREWEAGVPIDLDAIRDKDEQYWNNYKGTPKAFVAVDKALEMWSNRFGSYTAFRYPAATFNEATYNAAFAKNITPADLGMMVEPVRRQGVQAAQNGTDFSGLFIGLSFFILVAAIVLTALLFRLNLENRSSQIGLLAALGFQQKQIRGFYISEGLVVAILGAVLGTNVAVFYTQLVFKVLNTLWFDIVRTNVLEIQILPSTLVIGLLISVVVSLLAIYLSLHRFQKKKIVELQQKAGNKTSKKWERIYSFFTWISLGVAVGVFVSQLADSKQDPALFFISGGLLLVGLLLLFRKFLLRLDKQKERQISVGMLPKVNLARNVGRSLTVVVLFALGTFITVSTGSNKLDLFAGAQEKTSGTGGFMYFAETTMPVLFNINDKEKRAEEGVYEDFYAVQFRKVEGDDASCLNLNRTSQPAILGVDPENLVDRFSFAATIKGLEGDPWEKLSKENDDGTIPAIADQTVIQWGLGKKIGDILLYQNELGDTLRLKLIAGTKPSIFQGYVIISNQNFLRNFPSSSGSNIFLIDGDKENEQKIGEELQSVFRDYGWEMELTAKRLVEFYSVTNTYLSIFLALGTLGLILGTIGLAVILARTILERKREISMMQAVGFQVSAIFKMLVSEYAILLSAGVIIGFVTAIVATLPSFLSTNTDASLSTVVLLILLILVNGFAWIAILSWLSLRRKILVVGLREE